MDRSQRCSRVKSKVFDMILCKFDLARQLDDHSPDETLADRPTLKTDNYNRIEKLKTCQKSDPGFRSFSPSHFHGDPRAHRVSFLSGRFFVVKKFVVF